MITHRGNCFCGAVEIQVEGAPEAMGYCHCSSCRSWAAPDTTSGQSMVCGYDEAALPYDIVGALYRQ